MFFNNYALMPGYLPRMHAKDCQHCVIGCVRKSAATTHHLRDAQFSTVREIRINLNGAD